MSNRLSAVLQVAALTTVGLVCLWYVVKWIIELCQGKHYADAFFVTLATVLMLGYCISVGGGK